MNNLSRFDRNKILINSEKNNILLPSSLYFQKHKNFTSNNHEETKANFVINKNNNNNNFNSYSIKNSKGFNLMFEYKNNINWLEYESSIQLLNRLEYQIIYHFLSQTHF